MKPDEFVEYLKKLEASKDEEISKLNSRIYYLETNYKRLQDRLEEYELKGMPTTLYIPILEWGKDRNSSAGNAFGSEAFTDLQLLYCYTDAVGHFEVSGLVPTQAEFERKIQEENEKVRSER